MKTAIANVSGTRLAYLNDGVDTPQAAEAVKSLEDSSIASMIWYQPSITSLVALRQAVNNANGLTVRAVRPSNDRGQNGITVGAFDEKGRRIAETGLVFTAGETTGEAVINAPYELRNDFHTLRVDGAAQAGATYLIDDNNKRRRVALLSGSDADLSQPLLSPLYYISRALEPFADLCALAIRNWCAPFPNSLNRSRRSSSWRISANFRRRLSKLFRIGSIRAAR